MYKTVKISDHSYPVSLKKIASAPVELYYNGTFDDAIFKNCVAVVGSRYCSEYGKRITEKLVKELSYSGITVVSGFMYGIDSYAHKSSVEVGGRTIGILPYGIDSKIPSYQSILYGQILRNNGLIMSEYPGSLPSKKWMFVQRNRIIVGLSKVVLLVEGALNSGTLVTANIAKKSGVPVYAIPGHIDSKVSEGVNDLIKNGSAKMLTNVNDLLSLFNATAINTSQTNNGDPKITQEDYKIINLLKTESLGIEQLSQKTKIDFSELSSSLIKLELLGYIKEKHGKYLIAV